MEQTNALCHCSDCVGYCQATTAGFLTDNQASYLQLVQFYKSDVTVTKGSDMIAAVKLHTDTVMIRCHCKICGTPLGADIGPGPVVLLYSKLLTDYDTVFLPSLVLNMASALPGTRAYDRNTIVRQGLGAPWFIFRVVSRSIIFRVVSRMLLGFIMGKGVGGLLNGDYANVPVGMDKIAFANQKKKI
jgi:hypothetical protein